MTISPLLKELRKSLTAKVASLEIDPMKTFSELCPDELPVIGALEIVSPINKIAAKTDVRIATKCAHSEDAEWITEENSEIGQERENPQSPHKWKKHGVPGTLGFELLDGLPKPTDYDHFIWKGMETDLHPYGACYQDPLRKISTGLIEWLVMNDVTKVVVSGLAYDFCVKTTALELAETGLFEVVVVKEATRGIFVDTFDAVEKELTNSGVKVINTVEEL